MAGIGAASPMDGHGPPPIRGRDPELATLGQALRDTAGGRGRIVVAEGEAGIGKTRLLQEAWTMARASGFLLLQGAGYELGHEHRYETMAQVLDLRRSPDDASRTAIAELLRRAPGGGQHLEYRLLEDVLALLERLSIERPLVVTVDDLQWVDSASLAVLAHVGRHLAPLRAALVLAVRPPPRRQHVDQLLRSVAAAASWVRLEGLAQAPVRDLVAEVVGGPAPVELLRQVARAAGNPLFVRELASAYHLTGEPDEQALPPSIHRLVGQRLSGFPAPTAHALTMASALGSHFSLTDLADLLERPAADLAERLGPALEDRLLVAAGPLLSFRHQLVRDAIYGGMPLGVRSAVHRDVGRMLIRRDADALLVATHLALGGDTGRTEAVDWLRRAADEASACSPTQAVELLDRALELGGPRHAARDDMLVDRALALTWAGRADESLRTARELLVTCAGTPREDRLRLGMAQTLMVQARWSECSRELEILAERSDVAETHRARLLGDAAVAHAHAGDLERAVTLAERARGTGERLGDHMTRSIALTSLAVVAHFEARYQDSVRAAREAVELARQSDHREAALRPTPVWLGLGLADVDEFAEALLVLQTGRQLSEDAGMNWQLPLYDDGIGSVRFYAGEWDNAVAEMQTCIAMAQEMGTLWWLVPANCMLAYVAIQREQDDLAEAAIDMARRHAGSAHEFGANRLMWIQGLHREAGGDLDGAMALLEQGWLATMAAGFLPHCLIIGPDLVRVAVAVGATERAAAVTEVVELVAGRTGVPSAVAAAQRCRGLVEGDSGLLVRAVSVLRASPRRMDLAAACEDAGTILAGEGDAPAAMPLLDEALAGYRRAGARRGARRVVAVLRTLGARRAQPGRVQRPLLGWDALTETERRVADLAARGLTNPEIGSRLFISRRTVATHLAHIFGKLEISSRVELARLAAERPADAGMG